jgi:hypothetical protein
VRKAHYFMEWVLFSCGMIEVKLHSIYCTSREIAQINFKISSLARINDYKNKGWY